ncbi:MAG: cohesin domain-containing protein [bacterium]
MTKMTPAPLRNFSMILFACVFCAGPCRGAEGGAGTTTVEIRTVESAGTAGADVAITATATVEVKGAPSIEEAPAEAPAAAPATEGAPAEATGEPAAPALPPVLKVKNEFIYFEVNTGPAETGRFSIETVRGDPSTAMDDGKILIYGRPRPWTSFTTVRVDGEDYVFGGASQRRAGRGGRYGGISAAPAVVDGGAAVEMKCGVGGLVVTQRLELAGGAASGLTDSVRVTYTVENPGLVARRAGLRVLLDTLLGSNDGAPFRVGERDVTVETRLAGDDVPEYWVAFDSLENPGVVARGTLRGEGLTPPDEVVFANWGKAADRLFDLPYEEGRSFLREGEEEMDSATALLWREREIAPGGSLRFATMYGIDYLNVVGDVLVVGANPRLGRWATAKNQVRTRTLYAYVGNAADFPLSDVRVSLEAPKGVRLSEGETAERRLKTLAPGEERAVGWRVEPEPFGEGERKLKISARSAEVEPVTLTTSVTLLSPPGIDASLEAPRELTVVDGKRYGPSNPFEIRLVCRNRGESPIDNLEVALSLPEGLVFPGSNRPVQSFPRLDGRETLVFAWKVIATGERSGILKYNVLITSDSTESRSITRTVRVPPMPTKIEWLGVPREAAPGVIFPAEVFVSSARKLKGASFSVRFNPEVLQAIRVSQGTAFVEGGTASAWREPRIDNEAGVVSGIEGSRGAAPFTGNGSLAIVHFTTAKPGWSGVMAVELALTDERGEAMEFLLENAEIAVKKP